jgi:hypothetical protein
MWGWFLREIMGRHMVIKIKRDTARLRRRPLLISLLLLTTTVTKRLDEKQIASYHPSEG